MLRAEQVRISPSSAVAGICDLENRSLPVDPRRTMSKKHTCCCTMPDGQAERERRIRALCLDHRMACTGRGK